MLAALFLGCQKKTESHSFSNPASGVTIDLQGNITECAPRDPAALCTQELTEVDKDFEAKCSAYAGIIERCGPCGKNFACTVGASDSGSASGSTKKSNIFDQYGKQMECFPRDDSVMCAQVISEVDSRFKASCGSVGGKIERCGPCGMSFGCAAETSPESITPLGVIFDKKGAVMECPERDATAICIQVVREVEQGFELACNAAGGSIKQCGICGLSFGCTEKP